MKAGWNVYESPLGPLTLVAGRGGIRAVRFPGRSSRPEKGARQPMPQAVAQLEEYFAGRREDFELPLDISGTRLQLLVWDRLRRIPYGQTISYGDLAEGIEDSAFPEGLQGHERVRTVGAEVGRTPTPILIPCHRVIGADGSLTGYGGGLQRKRALLDLEQGVTSLLG